MPPEHPEAFIEAFANVYMSVAATIRARHEQVEPDELSWNFPSVCDGARSVPLHREDGGEQPERDARAAANATFHPARERTATVLQPGRYKLVRGGQTVAVSAAKYLQNIEITGRARTG